MSVFDELKSNINRTIFLYKPNGIKELLSLNEGKLVLKSVGSQNNCIIETNMYLDDIKFPLNIKVEDRFYNDDNTMQSFLKDRSGKILGVLNSKKRHEQIKREEEYRFEKAKEERLQKLKEFSKNNKLSRNEMETASLNRYKSFLISNGADLKVVNMQSINDLIISIIKNADSKVLYESTPVEYLPPRSDGTFDIKPIKNNYKYVMEKNNVDPDRFIVLIKNTMDEMSEEDSYKISRTEIIYINKEGKITDVESKEEKYFNEEETIKTR